MKLLILGGNGQVGWELQRACAPLGVCNVWDRNQCDLANLNELEKQVIKEAPDVLINAAAYTAVDKAESESKLAATINRDVPEILARCMKQLGGWLIHYSTDYVFDGQNSSPYLESESPNPLSVYGETKLAGERAIESSNCRYVILRTSWVYALRGNNFPKTMLRLAQAHNQLKVVNDQFGAPTSAELIADVSAHLVHTFLNQDGDNDRYRGVYHLVAGGKTNWHELATYVIDTAANLGLELNVGVEDIIPVPSSEYPVAAKRPVNSLMCNEKIQETFSLTLPDWQLHIKRFVTEYVEQVQK